MTTSAGTGLLQVVASAWLAMSVTQAQAADIAQLAWLGGCWKSDAAEPGSGEHWMPLAGGTLLGVSRTVEQGRTVEFEFMKIGAAADGQLAFTAMPAGQQPATFPLVHLSDSEAIFENLQHDFPQRVVYRLESETKLRARIEGTRHGALKVVEFPMTRANCESLLRVAAEAPAA